MQQDAGADCVKFQKTDLSHKFTSAALQRPYTDAHSWGQTYGEHKKYLEFNEQDFRELKSYAEKLNLAFSASPKDIVGDSSPEQVPSVTFSSVSTWNSYSIRYASFSTWTYRFWK